MNDLKTLIEGSKSILITSHISPDGDSISSSLLLYKILKTNYSNKTINVSMEEEAFGLDFLDGYSEIIFKPLSEQLNQQRPDVLIVLDANALHRITRDLESTEKSLDSIKPKIVVIDHHQGNSFENTDLIVNNGSPAVTLDIYQIFLEELKYDKPDNYAQIALTGIYTDTGGFIYSMHSDNANKTFEVVPKLINDGANVELLSNNLNQISAKSLTVLNDLINNTKYKEDFTYSFISDQTANLENQEAMVQACEIFRNSFLRNIEGHPWGFIVYRDLMAPEVTYSVSMRALTGTKDVSLIASALGGGGHKPAAGAKIKVANVDEAVQMVLTAIEQTNNS